MSLDLWQKLRQAWAPRAWSDVTVLVAVSGGADSVALWRALVEVREPGEGRLVAAHFNHRLRGEEADGDQRFVETLARECSSQVIVGSADSTQPPTSEAACREARYAFLTTAAAKCGARYIATAHTADDQVETVLLNLVRGTGLAGLAGIPRMRVIDGTVTIIRPFLDVTRQEILQYLQASGQTYREDASNQGDDYLRNRIRHKLLPLLEEEFSPHVRESVRRVAQVAGQANHYLNEQAANLIEPFISPSSQQLTFPADHIGAAHSAVLRQALVQVWQRRGWPLADMTSDKWEQLAALVRGETGRKSLNLPGGVTAELAQGVLKLTPG